MTYVTYDSVRETLRGYASLGSIQHSGFGFPLFRLGWRWRRIAPVASVRRLTRLNASILRQKSDALALSLGTLRNKPTASHCQNGQALRNQVELLRDENRLHPAKLKPNLSPTGAQRGSTWSCVGIWMHLAKLDPRQAHCGGSSLRRIRIEAKKPWK